MALFFFFWIEKKYVKLKQYLCKDKPVNELLAKLNDAEDPVSQEVIIGEQTDLLDIIVDKPVEEYLLKLFTFLVLKKFIHIIEKNPQISNNK